MIKKLNGNQIKMIAIIAMFMDHFATTLYSNYEKFWWLLLIHLIGRVAAPIMWFMVVEGYTHTHSLKKGFEDLMSNVFKEIFRKIIDFFNYRSLCV